MIDALPSQPSIFLFLGMYCTAHGQFLWMIQHAFQVKSQPQSSVLEGSPASYTLCNKPLYPSVQGLVALSGIFLEHLRFQLIPGLNKLVGCSKEFVVLYLGILHIVPPLPHIDFHRRGLPTPASLPLRSNDSGLCLAGADAFILPYGGKL